MASLQEGWRAEWATRAAALVARARDLACVVPPERLHRSPGQRRWSAAQVFEHLAIANESYLRILRRIAADAPPPAPPDATWRPTLVGGLLVRSFASPRRLPAPRMYRPPPPRPDVIAAFTGGMDEFARLLDRLAGAHWRAVRLSSPVSRLLRLNLGDCFAIVVHHAERHFRQIDRALAASDPGRTPGPPDREGGGAGTP